MTGYFEADFLSAGVTSNNNQSNSYILRQRQAWAQAALKNGWTFTGGQMWSLVTETKVGEDNRTEALPMTIDPQYTVGFSWARQYGFRVTKNFSNKVWAGFSVENSQETITTHGNTPTTTSSGRRAMAGGLYNAGDQRLLHDPQCSRRAGHDLHQHRQLLLQSLAGLHRQIGLPARLRSLRNLRCADRFPRPHLPRCDVGEAHRCRRL